MKKIGLHMYIVLGIFIIGFILGSFLDLQLSTAIFSEKNGFGLFLSTIGTMPGYGCLAVIGGGLFAVGLTKREWRLPYMIILMLLGIGATITSIYFSGREFFGENGFYGVAPEWVGYFIALPFMLGLFYLGYGMARKSDNNRLWLLLIVMAVAIFIALVPGVTALKSIFHRPRFRTAVYYGYSDFHNWWQPCKNYKEIIATSELTKEEFKSFPSGHAGASAVFMLSVIFLPLVNIKYEKIQLPLFYGGLAWTLLIAWSRIFVGAHFLSDVSMGGILTMVCALVAYYVVMRDKIGLPKEEEIPAE